MPDVADETEGATRWASGSGAWSTRRSRARTAAAPADRLGPYDTREEASRALEKVAERNAAWDNDPNWNDEGAGD